MKRQTEMVEGPEAWKRFEGVMKGVLAVPHSEIQRRIKEHRRKAASNPNQRSETESQARPRRLARCPRLRYLPGQLLIRQPPPHRLPHRRHEPSRIVRFLTVVVAERLLVKVAEQVEGLDARHRFHGFPASAGSRSSPARWCGRSPGHRLPHGRSLRA